MLQRDGCPHLRHFDSLYAADDDPWRAGSSGDEAFKRRAIDRALGCRPLAKGLEVGCGNGISTMALAPRFAHLLAIDGSQEAVRHARLATARLRNVTVLHRRLPMPIVGRSLDAVVASEVLYYLPPPVLVATLRSIRAGLRTGGRLVSVNHLRRFADSECGFARLADLTRAVFGGEVRSLMGHGWRCDVFLKR